MDLIHLVQGRDQWWAVVNVILDHYIPENAGNFVTG